MNTNEGVLSAISVAVGAIITNLAQKWSSSRKERAEAKKTNIEGRVLSASEQREKDKFTEEQLTKLENRFINLQAENEILQKENRKLMVQINELLLKLEESQKKTRQALSDITFLKAKLAAYEP